MSRRPLTAVERVQLEGAADHHAAVAADLRDVLQHGWPDPANLGDAPTVDDWTLGSVPVDGLHGVVVLASHEPGGSAHRFRSVLHAHSVAAGVARVARRWVRLGRPGESSR